MAHYKFLKDLKDGKRGEVIALSALLKTGLYKYSSDKPPSQKHGDFQIVGHSCGTLFNVEVKYDIMAENTGNMCFELANGKGDYTGIMSTQADILAYVLNNKGSYVVYLFSLPNIKEFLFNGNKSVRVVNGGDRKRYSMALAPVDLVSKVAFLTIEISNAELQVSL